MKKMTEEQAKNILDFLAQKHGNGHVTIAGYDDYVAIKWKIKDLTIGQKCMLHYTLGRSGPCSILPCSMFKRSYNKLLDFLLKMSSEGIAVFVYKPIKDAYAYLGWSIERVVFFPAYTTLEEIMIAKDLNENA